MRKNLLARRASRLPGVLPVSPPVGTISFESGHAFAGLLPDLEAVAARALSTHRGQTLQYGPKPGIPELRDWLATYEAEEGIHVTRDQVLVTNGAKQAIELICRLLLDEGDSIVITAPTYFTAIPIFRSFGINFIEATQDDEGIDVAELASLFTRLRRQRKALPKFIYNVPDFHNPTGITMSLERRKALIDLATKEQVYVIEDSPYRKIRFEGTPVPPLKALDLGGVVFHVGTFSKLMAPGLRVGWIAASSDLIARLIQLKSDNGSCPLTQRIIFDYCAAGQMPGHTKRVVATYRVHRDRMIHALRQYVPEVSFDVPNGGYYMWLKLPVDVDGDELAKRALDAGVNVLPPSKCFARPEAHARNYIRVAFTHASVDEIDEGVHRLAFALRSWSAPPAVAVAR